MIFENFHNFLTLYTRLCGFSGTQVHLSKVQGARKHRFRCSESGGMPGIDVGMNFAKTQKSIFSAKDIKITMANVGISSKDSSTSAVNFLEITDAITCAEAFQKKQEFFGANLKISSLICNSKILNKDNNSFIQVL